jgi:CheY-like chemotaxis protein
MKRSTTQNMPPLQILAIEDDAVAARFLCDAIVHLGHAVQHAADGADGLALTVSTRFDWVITDLRLPDMRGEDVLARLRAGRNASAQTPVVAISGELSAQRRRALLDAGFHAAWEKPLRLAQLHTLLLPAQPGVKEAGAAYAVRTAHACEFDDAAALAACGSADVLAGLRTLFATELPEQIARLRSAITTGDLAAIDAIAHKLRGGCRFCGATALQRALDALGPASNATSRARVLERIEELAQRAQARFDLP